MKRRIAVSALIAAGVACSLNVEAPADLRIILSPVLDSIFVGDQLLHRTVTFYDAHGNNVNPGPVTWSSSDTTVISVDAGTGKITGLKAGVAAVLADAQAVEGFAVVVVSPTLKVTALLDSLAMMPTDTFTAPVAVTHANPGSPLVWFTATANPTFDIDSSTGLVTAKAVGGPTRFVVHAALAPDTVADSGTVQVIQMTDTSGGKAYYTIFGTAQRARRVGGYGLTYSRHAGAPTFNLHLPTQSGAITNESVDLILLTPPAAPGTFPIDSISTGEAQGQTDPYCNPPRNWGSWFTTTSTARLDAVSRQGGSITISQMVTVTGGVAISGHFFLPTVRTDRYSDPSAGLPVRGSFVLAVVPGARICT
jgi:hypothetical protein